MVTVGLLYCAILSEAFIVLVVVDMDFRAVPVAMAFDAEVVVAFDCKVGLAGAGFEEALSQRNAGGDAATAHFFDRKVGIFADIAFLWGFFRCSGLYRLKCRKKARK